MAYARRRSTRRTSTRRYASTGRHTTSRRAPVRRRVSAGRVRKSRTARPREQVVRIVVQNAPDPAGQVSNAALAAMGVTPSTVKPKKARIGSND